MRQLDVAWPRVPPGQPQSASLFTPQSQRGAGVRSPGERGPLSFTSSHVASVLSSQAQPRSPQQPLCSGSPSRRNEGLRMPVLWTTCRLTDLCVTQLLGRGEWWACFLLLQRVGPCGHGCVCAAVRPHPELLNAPPGLTALCPLGLPSPASAQLASPSCVSFSAGERCL